MTDANDAALAQLRQSLVDSAGNYLKNTLHLPGNTCASCAGPVGGYHRCYKCEWIYARRTDTADLVGSMIYGIETAEGHQSEKLMWGYKVRGHSG